MAKRNNATLAKVIDVLLQDPQARTILLNQLAEKSQSTVGRTRLGSREVLQVFHKDKVMYGLVGKAFREELRARHGDMAKYAEDYGVSLPTVRKYRVIFNYDGFIDPKPYRNP